MVNIKMVTYDCDGVIFDSGRANLEYYNYIFKHFNLPTITQNDTDKLKILHTYSNDDVLKHFFPEPDEYKKALEFSKTVDYAMFYKYMTLEKNFFEAAYKLKEKNILITVATNRSISFKGIVKFFKLDKVLDDYVTVLDVEKPKPEPDMLLLLLQRHNIKPKEMIFIGDSMLDLIASQKAKTNFIGYKFFYKNIATIKNHLEILDFIK